MPPPDVSVMPPDVSTIVVSYNTRQATLECVGSLLAQAGVDVEVVVIDNASGDGTPAALAAAHPQVRLVAQRENLGFARGCNVGARLAAGRYLGFFNSDCLAEPECVSRLACYLDGHDAVSVAVPRVISADGRVERNIAVLPTVCALVSEHVFGRVQDPYRVAKVSGPVEVEVCSGAALLIRRDDFWSVGGFDESFFMYLEDVELCRRLGAVGKRIVYVPDAVTHHEGGVSAAPNSAALARTLAHNREVYLRRAMGPVRAALAVLAVRLGRGLTPLRNRVVGGLRR